MSSLLENFRKKAGDPFVVSIWIASLLMLGGFVAFLLSWRGVAATLAVPVQLPYLISGGVGGLSLLIVGGSIVLVQTSRRRAAREYRQLGEILERARAILDNQVR